MSNKRKTRPRPTNMRNTISVRRDMRREELIAQLSARMPEHDLMDLISLADESSDPIAVLEREWNAIVQAQVENGDGEALQQPDEQDYPRLIQEFMSECQLRVVEKFSRTYNSKERQFEEQLVGFVIEQTFSQSRPMFIGKDGSLKHIGSAPPFASVDDAMGHIRALYWARKTAIERLAREIAHDQAQVSSKMVDIPFVAGAKIQAPQRVTLACTSAEATALYAILRALRVRNVEIEGKPITYNTDVIRYLLQPIARLFA